MISSRLIGRTSELAELEAALADAASSRPSLAFVAGESGVGKSRLISEPGRRAGERAGTLIADVDATPATLGPVIEAWRSTAGAELARVRGAADPRAWAAAAAAWAAVGWPLPAAHAAWRQVEALAAAGERDDAGAIAAEALGTTRELGARRLAGEIGAALFMAEKTASVHVSRILAKVDVRSRTHAAHVAHRHGLAV